MYKGNQDSVLLHKNPLRTVSRRHFGSVNPATVSKSGLGRERHMMVVLTLQMTRMNGVMCKEEHIALMQRNQALTVRVNIIAIAVHVTACRHGTGKEKCMMAVPQLLTGQDMNGVMCKVVIA